MVEYPDHVIVCRHCGSPIERFEGIWGRLDGIACSGAECAPLSVEDYDIGELSRIVDRMATAYIQDLRAMMFPKSA